MTKVLEKLMLKVAKPKSKIRSFNSENFCFCLKNVKGRKNDWLTVPFSDHTMISMYMSIIISIKLD